MDDIKEPQIHIQIETANRPYIQTTDDVEVITDERQRDEILHRIPALRGRESSDFIIIDTASLIRRKQDTPFPRYLIIDQTELAKMIQEFTGISEEQVRLVRIKLANRNDEKPDRLGDYVKPEKTNDLGQIVLYLGGIMDDILRRTPDNMRDKIMHQMGQVFQHEAGHMRNSNSPAAKAIEMADLIITNSINFTPGIIPMLTYMIASEIGKAAGLEHFPSMLASALLTIGTIMLMSAKGAGREDTVKSLSYTLSVSEALARRIQRGENPYQITHTTD